VAITAGGPDLAARVRAVLDAGVEVLVREQELPHGIAFDRVILHARMPGAAEVATSLHLSGEMDVAAWRARFRGALSVSCHARDEALAKRLLGADAAFLSPIFASRHGRPALGTGGLRGLVALGGVDASRVDELRAAGAVGIAVSGAIFGARDPGEAAAALRARVARAPDAYPPSFSAVASSAGTPST
jgi:thiamine-phosphate pyrophosphorylase